MEKIYKIASVCLVFLAIATTAIADSFTAIPDLNLTPGHTVAFVKEGQGYMLLTKRLDDGRDYLIYDKDLQQVANVFYPNSENDSWSIYAPTLRVSNGAEYMDDNFYFSQTLFNDDEEFEYVMKVYKSGSYELSMLRLMQTNGNCLAEISLADYSWANLDYIFLLGDQMYFVINDDNGYYWYRWEKDSSSLKMVSKTISNAIGRPNPVHRGEPFTIQLGADAEGTSAAAIYDVRGGLATTAQGEGSSLTVDTSVLAPGHYVYRVSTNGKEVSTGKLIVR